MTPVNRPSAIASCSIAIVSWSASRVRTISGSARAGGGDVGPEDGGLRLLGLWS